MPFDRFWLHLCVGRQGGQSLIIVVTSIMHMCLQVNNQPPVLGEMAIACEVVNNATAAGQSPLAAIATLYTYMGSNGSSHWCYNFTYDPRFTLLPDVPTGYNSYTYQCCAEATVYSSELPAKESDSTMNPEPIPVPVREIEYNCL